MGAVSSRARYLVIVPIVVALLDLGENISIYLLLTNFPDITDARLRAPPPSPWQNGGWWC